MNDRMKKGLEAVVIGLITLIVVLGIAGLITFGVYIESWILISSTILGVCLLMLFLMGYYEI